MEVFDRLRRKGIWLPKIPGALPFNPSGFSPNWGNTLTPKLAFLLVPHPLGFYYDLVRGRPAIFGGTGAVTRASTPFGNAYVFGAAAGGQTSYALMQDGAQEPPTNGITLAAGAYNQTTISNVTMGFAEWQDTPAQANRFTLYVGNSSGIPRMQAICTVASSATNITANGGAGTTMAVSGQAMTYAASYNGTTILANYNSTGQGNQTGSGAKTGWPTSMTQVTISDNTTGNYNSGRAMLWIAGWYRAMNAADLVSVCAGVGGLPSNFIRRR